MSTPSRRTSKPPVKKPLPKRPVHPPKGAAKPPTPKAGTSADAATTLRTAVGASLLAAVKETPDLEGVGAIIAVAEALARGDTVGHGQLKALKAAVNALAVTLRAAKKTALARQCSQANRGVRRLERAARPAA